ncbi:exosome non-catalytic core subunit rrp46 [Tulasnella sp. UAMH 9824]|nr:exosome non-catalytic core subunit rrp46 [Tulasnella sp. UAMH 9824]
MSMEWGGLSRVDGSARFAFGSTSVVASVSGPIEVRLNAELPSKATLEVNMRPLIGLSATPEKHYAKQIRDVFEQILILSQHPRSLVQLVVQALSPITTSQWNRPSYILASEGLTAKSSKRATDVVNPTLIAASLNAASLAFLNASSIPMRGTLCAVAVGKKRSTTPSTRSSAEDTGLVLDPTEDEFEDGWGVFAFAFGQNFVGGDKAASEPVWVDCVGLGDGITYSTAVALAQKGASDVMKCFREELTKER